GVQVAVQNTVILDSHAVTGARLEHRGERLFLRLLLTPDGQERLDGTCFGNMGKQLAIIYGDRLLCAPTIDQWDEVELVFEGMDDDWPEVAGELAAYLDGTPESSGGL